MSSSFVRIVAVLVLLLASATFSFCPSVLAALAEASAAEVQGCCTHPQEETEDALPTGECAAAECSCVTCLTVLSSTPTLSLSGPTTSDLHTPCILRKPPAGFLASIDYPPEPV